LAGQQNPWGNNLTAPKRARRRNMLEWTKNHFRLAVVILLWLNVIFCVIGGAVTGYGLGGRGGSVGLAFLGAIVGIVVGLISNVIFGGIVAVFLNMDEKLEEIRNHLLGTPQNYSADTQKSANFLD
jgi:membrane associated rhomboid family serine protease